MAGYSDRLATRIALAVSGMALLFVVLVGFGAWLVTTELLRSQVSVLLRGQLNLAKERAALVAMSASDLLILQARSQGGAELAANTVEIAGIPARLAVVDGSGAVHRGSRHHGATVSAPWVADAIARNLPAIRLGDDADGPVLDAVMPGEGGGWGVLLRLPLQGLVDHLGQRDDKVRITVTDRAGLYRTAEHGAVEDRSMVVSDRLALPGLFADVGLVLELAPEPALLSDPQDRLTAFFLAMAGVTPLVVIVLAMVVGRRLTRRLSRLVDAAAGFGSVSTDRSVFETGGDDEIARLGKAFAGTVERLDRAYRDMEARGRALLSNTERVAQIGSATWSPEGEQQVWSDQFYAVLGLDPAEKEACRSAFFSRVHPDDRDRLVAALGDETGRVVEDFRLIRPDGVERIAQLRAELARGPDGVPLRIDVTIQDISERKRLEGRLDGLVGELKRSNEELEQFAYVASHDLRQPLRTVRSYISLIEESLEDRLDGETREFMDFIRDGVKRMDSLITDLLAYSRVGRIGKDGPVDTGRAVDLALLDLQSQIDEANAHILVPDRLPVVSGEAGEMTRLFQNLVGNAVKYRAADRRPMVTIGCAERPGEWEFFIRDNGIGIPEEHAERIFGIFQRLHARHEYEGTGIGLAICRKIVERQGGRIWAAQIEGQGAEFRFTWPKLRRQDTDKD
ncbi:sensor histidine kinase [Magnetospirillum moscoviense]|uniref:histidine kinase n=1 Tax=Magnetospirillum moscoviense TaxID=1437059 RepID=A0A178MJJ9_9PROT|nr:ATP-binding protein [Magnetospirillum moscoviense]OAN48911.1 hypothetical protein A6A05_02700 [Magnetospirillum moscoviense]